MNTWELSKVAQSGLLSVWDYEGRVHVVRLDLANTRELLRRVKGPGGVAPNEHRNGGVPEFVADGHHREYDDSWMEGTAWN